MELPEGLKIILSDTVGFISDLPTQLVASFRATLEEVLEADVVLHVRDISHPQTNGQKQAVLDTLRQLNLNPEVPMLEVLNKIDALSPEDAALIDAVHMRENGVFAISSLTGQGIDALLSHVAQSLQGQTRSITLSLPWSEGAAQSWLQREGVIETDLQTDDGWTITVRWTAHQQAKFEKQFPAIFLS